MLGAATKDERRKEETRGHKNPHKKSSRKADGREEEMLGRLNVVWGYTVIKMSCLRSLRAPVRAADTNSRRIK